MMQPPFPRWQSTVLRAAAVYNLAWGALTVLSPAWLFDLTGLEPPTYPFIWQCVGMIVGVYGVGYWIAASNPLRHWPIVLVGLLGKVLGPIGYLQGLLTGAVPAEFGVTLVTNDLIWWAPFALILWGALRAAHTPRGSAEPLHAVLNTMRTSTGVPLIDRTRRGPVLLVLLRHAGCTFCKEALADLAAVRPRLDVEGVTPILVHMSEPTAFDALLRRHALEGVEHIADPDRRLYRALELGRGSFTQLFGPKVWLRGVAATLRGHMVGRLEGDGFQMPGAFLLRDGLVLRAFRHRTAADRPDYAAIACELPADGPARAMNPA
jgi:hypothetical protein